MSNLVRALCEEVAATASVSVDFFAELGRRRIPINYGLEDLKSDAAALKEKFCRSATGALN